MTEREKAGGAAVCPVCPRHCSLTVGQVGACRARKNIAGEVKSLNYGRATSLALDPVEKKPFARWQGGNFILSVGSFGCNFHCPFCQNYSISQAGADFPAEELSPERLAALSKELISRKNVGVAFTYNEPLIGFEYILDVAGLVKAAGQKVALVTNGGAETAILEKILPYTDAVNIDLKSWREDFYRKIGGDLETVKRNIALAARRCHVEVTTLIIPDENDSAADMSAEAEWLATLGEDIPLHISRFFPRYRVTNKEPTSIEVVYGLADVARKSLRYVYTGNC